MDEKTNPLQVYYMTEIGVLKLDEIITHFRYTIGSKMGMLEIPDQSIHYVYPKWEKSVLFYVY